MSETQQQLCLGCKQAPAMQATEAGTPVCADCWALWKAGQPPQRQHSSPLQAFQRQPMDPARQALLAWGLARGCPRFQILPHLALVAGEAAWRNAVTWLTPAELAAALMNIGIPAEGGHHAGTPETTPTARVADHVAAV